MLTRPIRRPDTNRLKLSTAQSTILEQVYQARTQISSTVVDLTVRQPGVIFGKFRWIGGYLGSVSEEILVPASLQTSQEDFVDSVKWGWVS